MLLVHTPRFVLQQCPVAADDLINNLYLVESNLSLYTGNLESLWLHSFWLCRFSRSCHQEVGNLRTCRQDVENSRSCFKILKINVPANKMLKILSCW